MSGEESQEPYEDSGAGGPGAPTPLSTLEVDARILFIFTNSLLEILNNSIGSCRPHGS